MAPKSDLERRIQAKLEAATEQRRQGGAAAPKRKDKAEAASSQPPKRIKVPIRLRKRAALAGMISGVSDPTSQAVGRDETTKSAEGQSFGEITTPPSHQADMTITQMQIVASVRPEPSSSSNMGASSITLPIRAEDTLEHASVAASYMANMFSEQDLRRLGHMKAGGMHFESSVSRHLLDSLLLLRGLEETHQSEKDMVGRWRARAMEEKKACKKAEAAESKTFAEMERMKAYMQKMEISLKNQEVLAEQAMDKYNQASNALTTAQNSLELERSRHQQDLDELKIQMKAEMRNQMELARVEAVEAYKSSEAFANAVEEAALPGAMIGMRLYRAALKDTFPDLDLSPLDGQYPQSLPSEDDGEPSEPFSPVIDIATSPDQPPENLVVPEAETRHEESQPKAVPSSPVEPATVQPPLSTELETILSHLPEEQSEAPTPSPSESFYFLL